MIVNDYDQVRIQSNFTSIIHGSLNCLLTAALYPVLGHHPLLVLIYLIPY